MSNPNYYCPDCDRSVSDPAIEHIPLPNGKFHLKASCPDCGRYFKFLPQGGPPTLHFGKHAGTPIAEIVEKDLPYLRWLLAQDWLKAKVRREIEAALDRGGVA